jgi:hypothetical protein
VNVERWDEKTQTGNWTILPDSETWPIPGRTCGGEFTCPNGYQCWNVGRNPSQGIYYQNIAQGTIGYDNFGLAMLTVFVFTTRESWANGMYVYQDSFSWIGSTLYHCLMMMTISYFCLNLFLAVVADSYAKNSLDDETDRVEEARLEKEKRRKNAIAEHNLQKEVDARVEEVIFDQYGEPLVPRPRDICSRVMHLIAYHTIFQATIVVTIVANGIVLAMSHARTSCLPLVSKFSNMNPMSEEFGYFSGPRPACIVQANTMSSSEIHFMSNANLVFVAVFSLEAVVKLIGFRPKFYFRDMYNVFDLIVLIVSLLDIGLTGKAHFTIFRLFRLARLLKLARSWASLRTLVESVTKTLPSMASLTVLLFIFMYIAAVAGMEIMGNIIPYSNRIRYTDFGIAMVAVFDCLTGENWNTILQSAIVTSGHNFAYIVYFFPVIFIGQYIVLNLYVSVVLAGFSTGPEPNFSFIPMLSACSSAFEYAFPSANRFLISISHKPDAAALLSLNEGHLDDSEETPYFTEAQLVKIKPNDPQQKSELLKIRSKARDAAIKRKHELEEEHRYGSMEMLQLQREKRTRENNAKNVQLHSLKGISLGMFNTNNVFRIRCMQICRNPMFENFVLACILVSCILLACRSPTTNTASEAWYALQALDFAFVIIFTIEVILKVVTCGFLWCPDAYLKDRWNVLDFVIVFIAWVSADYPFFSSANSSSSGGLRALRALRALRPLRTIQRFPGMRIAANVLLECVPIFLNVFIIVLFVMFIFGVIGVQYFGGKFWRCNDPSVQVVDQCWGCFWSPQGAVVMTDDPNMGQFHQSSYCPDGYSERKWRNSKSGFDNILEAVLTLFEISSLELWLNVMYASMDYPANVAREAHGVADFPFGANPHQEANPFAGLFVIVYIFVGVFIVWNMFTGVVIDKFLELAVSNKVHALFAI